jgi:hypothetical protein
MVAGKACAADMKLSYLTRFTAAAAILLQLVVISLGADLLQIEDNYGRWWCTK